MQPLIHPCLWFNGNAREAAEFYCRIFPNSKITIDTPMVVNFELAGQKYMGLNGGPLFPFTESVSFVINCANQQEVDYYWNALTANGGEESRCCWLKDKFGLSWQVVPRQLEQWMSGDPQKAKRVMEALMQMSKPLIAELENA